MYRTGVYTAHRSCFLAKASTYLVSSSIDKARLSSEKENLLEKQINIGKTGCNFSSWIFTENFSAAFPNLNLYYSQLANEHKINKYN
jgi:hypothetical protein